MKKVIFIHGYNSSPKKKKYQIISKELDKLGVEYSIPLLPGRKHPQSKKWLEIINKEVRKSTSTVVLVGHSLGTRAALLYLDKFEQKIDTVILIAAFDRRLENVEKVKKFPDFWYHKINIGKIKSLVSEFIVVHSKDDDLIPYKQGVTIAKELGAELITEEDKGHFGGEEKAEENARYFLKVIKSIL